MSRDKFMTRHIWQKYDAMCKQNMRDESKPFISDKRGENKVVQTETKEELKTPEFSIMAKTDINVRRCCR